MKVLSVGEVLWDVFPDRESLGGAPLNVCANLHRCGDEALLFSAVAHDPRGDAVLAAMKILGLPTTLMQIAEDRPTGVATVGKDATGETAFTILRPAAYDTLTLTSANLEPIRAFNPDWLYMGTLLQTVPATEQLVRTLIEALPQTRCFYDMNLRTAHWDLPLVERLCGAASILKINDVEAETLATLNGPAAADYSLEAFCATWAQRFQIDVICVTLGPAGCLIHTEGKAQRFPGYAVKVSDTVGAGDAFAAAFLHGYHQQWPMPRCAAFANALGALVASRPGATPPWQLEEVQALSGQ